MDFKTDLKVKDEIAASIATACLDADQSRLMLSSGSTANAGSAMLRDTHGDYTGGPSCRKRPRVCISTDKQLVYPTEGLVRRDCSLCIRDCFPLPSYRYLLNVALVQLHTSSLFPILSCSIVMVE